MTGPELGGFRRGMGRLIEPCSWIAGLACFQRPNTGCLKESRVRDCKENRLIRRVDLPLFPFLFAALLDDLAQRTWMLAVERGTQSLTQRHLLGKPQGHAGPGHRLQQRPVPTHHNSEQQGYNQVQEPLRHVDVLHDIWSSDK